MRRARELLLQRVDVEGRLYDDEGLPPGVTTFAT
jgi:hypothetical protein